MPSNAAQSTKTRGSEAGSVAAKPGVEWESARVRVRPDLLVVAPRGVDQRQLLVRVRDAATRQRRVRVLAVVAAREHDPDVDVVLAAVPEEVVLGGRLARDDHVAAREARVRHRRLPLHGPELGRPRLVHPVQVRVRAEPAVLLPEAVHGLEVRAPCLRLVRRPAADVRVRAPAVVRDRDPHRGELRGLLRGGDHLARLVEPPPPVARVAGGRLRVAVAPAVRGQPVRGEEAVEAGQRRVGRDAVEAGRLVRVRLRREVEPGEQAARDLVLLRQRHRRDRDGERDRRRDSVGVDEQRPAVVAGRSAVRRGHLQPERLVRVLRRALRAVPGHERVGHGLAVDRDVVGEEELQLERRGDDGRLDRDLLRSADEQRRVVDSADRHRERDGGRGMGRRAARGGERRSRRVDTHRRRERARGAGPCAERQDREDERHEPPHESKIGP